VDHFITPDSPEFQVPKVNGPCGFAQVPFKLALISTPADASSLSSTVPSQVTEQKSTSGHSQHPRMSVSNCEMLRRIAPAFFAPQSDSLGFFRGLSALLPTFIQVRKCAQSGCLFCGLIIMKADTLWLPEGVLDRLPLHLYIPTISHVENLQVYTCVYSGPHMKELPIKMIRYHCSK
jgi:hypothetical protein